MNRWAFVFFLGVICMEQIWAQADAMIDCHYAFDYKNLKDSKVRKKDEMVLRLGRGVSMFYSRWCWERQAIKDSLFARGASLEEVMGAIEQSKCPLSVLFTIIYKNYPQEGVFTITENLASLHFICTEEIKRPQWEIIDERAEILGYSCQKAVTKYYGREWTAWFTTEISFSEGPWKLHGLPGLILQAEDSEREFVFNCIELREAKDKIEIHKKKYVTCSKEELDELEKEHESNFNKFRKKRGLAYAQPVSKEPGYLPPDRIFNYIEQSSD